MQKKKPVQLVHREKLLREQESEPEEKGFLAWFLRNKLSIIVLLVAAAILTGLFLYARDESSPVFKPQPFDAATYEKAKVIAVTSDTLELQPVYVDEIKRGAQVMLCEILSGPLKGEKVEVENIILSFYGTQIKEGDEIVITLTVEYYEYGEDYPQDLPHYSDKDGIYVLESRPTVYSPNRTAPILLLLAIFFAVTWLVGGKTGLRSLLGLAITVICIIWLLCPLLMKGAPMIPTAFGLCVLVSVVCFVILGGVTKKTVCAMFGTAAGVLLAALFGEFAQFIAKVSSFDEYFVHNEIENFVYMQEMGIPLHVTGVLTAGIIISSLGAVMDVAMSVSSSLSELKAVNKNLTFKDLWKSGMNIGRDMVGTMTNTLILAFAGSSLVLIIYLWSLNPSFDQLVSSPYFSVEIISALSSSIGVILAVPLTVVIGAGFFSKEDGFLPEKTGIIKR